MYISSLLTANAFMDIFMIGFAEVVVVTMVDGRHATPTMGRLQDESKLGD